MLWRVESWKAQQAGQALYQLPMHAAQVLVSLLDKDDPRSVVHVTCGSESTTSRPPLLADLLAQGDTYQVVNESCGEECQVDLTQYAADHDPTRTYVRFTWTKHFPEMAGMSSGEMVDWLVAKKMLGLL